MTLENIREQLQQMAGSVGPAVSNIAKVKSVDEGKATCTLEDEDGQEILEVRLRPVLSGKKSFLQIPKVGSFVLAIRIEDDNDWLVIACDEVEKFIWNTRQAEVEISDKIHIEANDKNLLDLMKKLFQIIEKGYQTNTGTTIRLIMQSDFERLKNDFQTLLK